MFKMRGIAIAMTSLLASGAFAATTATVSKDSTAPANVSTNNQKILVKKAPAKGKLLAKKRALKARPLSAYAPQKAANAKLVAKNTDSASQQRVDAVQTSASSATTTSTMPGFTAGTSTAAATPQKKASALDKFKLGVLFEFYGPSVTDPFSGYQPDYTGSGYSQSDTAQELDTTLIIGYRINSNLTFSFNPMFATIGENAGHTDPSHTLAFSQEYSSIRLTVGKFVKAGKFTWNGDFRLNPGGLGDRTVGRMFYLRSGQNFMYQATSKINLAMYGTYRHYQFTSAYINGTEKPGSSIPSDPNNAQNDRITLSPAFEYQFTDSTVGSFSYNMDIRRKQISHDIVNAAPYYELGAMVDVTKAINLNPYIDIYPQRANIEAWQFGANVAISIL